MKLSYKTCPNCGHEYSVWTYTYGEGMFAFTEVEDDGCPDCGFGKKEADEESIKNDIFAIKATAITFGAIAAGLIGLFLSSEIEERGIMNKLFKKKK